MNSVFSQKEMYQLKKKSLLNFTDMLHTSVGTYSQQVSLLLWESVSAVKWSSHIQYA